MTWDTLYNKIGPECPVPLLPWYARAEEALDCVPVATNCEPNANMYNICFCSFLNICAGRYLQPLSIMASANVVVLRSGSGVHWNAAIAELTTPGNHTLRLAKIEPVPITMINRQRTQRSGPSPGEPIPSKAQKWQSHRPDRIQMAFTKIREHIAKWNELLTPPAKGDPDNKVRITRIELPNSLTTIPDGCFRYYEDLVEVILGNKVTKIGRSAFEECGSLQAIALPDTVTNIGEKAFFLCKRLQSVTLGKNITHIGRSAFEVCESLESVDIDGTFKTIPVLCFGRCTNLIAVTIRSITVTEIGACAFEDCIELSLLVLPNNIQNLESSVFSGCQSLTQVTLPTELQEMHSGAFRGCTALVSISFVECPAVTTICAGVFENCTALGVVDLSGNIKTIECRAFKNCTSLNSDYLMAQGAGEAITFRGSDETAFAGARPINIELNVTGALLTITDWADSSLTLQEIASRQHPEAIHSVNWEYTVPGGDGMTRELAYSQFEDGHWNELWATTPWQIITKKRLGTSIEKSVGAKVIRLGKSFTDLCNLEHA